VLALDHLHNEKRTAHRDLKPPNIFVNGNGGVKVGDLGLVYDFTPKTSTTSRFLCPTRAAAQPESGPTDCCVTSEYRPPEVWAGEEQNLTVDVWSLGVMIYEMMYGDLLLPFKRRNEADSATRGGKQRDRDYAQYLRREPPKFKEGDEKKPWVKLVKWMLNPDPGKWLITCLIWDGFIIENQIIPPQIRGPL